VQKFFNQNGPVAVI